MDILYYTVSLKLGNSRPAMQCSEIYFNILENLPLIIIMTQWNQQFDICIMESYHRRYRNVIPICLCVMYIVNYPSTSVVVVFQCLHKMLLNMVYERTGRISTG